MNWIEITISTTPEEIDTLCSSLEDFGIEGLIINDEAVLTDFIKNDTKYWDYIDDTLVKELTGVCSVQFYLEDSPSGLDRLESLTLSLSDKTFCTKKVRDEDWENNWREFYKPLEVGDRLLIVPEWENQPSDNERTVIKLDPGLIFGTGSHQTTQMCLEEAELYSGDSVLDLGCGSGILSIASLLLGSGYAIGCDIDDKAPDIASANAQLNGIGADRFVVYCGDFLTDKNLRCEIYKKRYDIIFANIVADVIISMSSTVRDLLSDDGVLICSGIIDGREDEVSSALTESGLKIINHRHVDNWHCYTATL